MSKRPCLATVVGLVLFAGSAGGAFAATDDYSNMDENQLDSEFANNKPQQYAQKRGGGRGGHVGGGSKKRNVNPGNKPSSSPGGSGGNRNVNINKKM